MKALTVSTTLPSYSKWLVLGLVLDLVLGLSTNPLLAQPLPKPFTDDSLDVLAGRALFERIWVSPPASTRASDGLGPLYNARSCSSCHLNAGRGKPLSSAQPNHADPSLVMHLEAPTDTALYGRQLQPFAVRGLESELAALQIEYSTRVVHLADGTPVELRQPHYSFSELAYEGFPAGRLSTRIAPNLNGLGDLARIPDTALLETADPDDLDGDGISGRLPRSENSKHYGRFGWRSTGTSLRKQSALALALDLGIGNPLFPAPHGDCSSQQHTCLEAAHATLTGAEPEAEAVVLDLLTAYLEALPAPETLNPDSPGGALFTTTGCAACHTPAFRVESPQGAVEVRPFSDLLLHDMGPGLADRNAAGEVLVSEWRTPPLWGMAERNQLPEAYRTWLHDGRARSVLEAIVWHGGEAESPKQTFMTLPPEDRQQLLEFVEAL